MTPAHGSCARGCTATWHAAASNAGGGLLVTPALGADGEGFDGPHLRVVEGCRVGEVAERHVHGVVTPKEVIADDQGWYPEDSTSARPLGVFPQPLLHSRVHECRLGIGYPHPASQIGDDRRVGDVAAFAEYCIQHGSYGTLSVAGGDDEALCCERIERMRWRHLQRQAKLSCAPDYETIGEATLGGDLPRADLPEMVEQPRQQHR